MDHLRRQWRGAIERQGRVTERFDGAMGDWHFNVADRADVEVRAQIAADDDEDRLRQIADLLTDVAIAWTIEVGDSVPALATGWV